MKKLLLRAFVLKKRWLDLNQSTRYQYRCRLYRDFKAVLSLSPTQADGIRLQTRYRGLQKNLFLFLDDSTIPPTNNASEQALRWSVIFRKVTNGFALIGAEICSRQCVLLSISEDDKVSLLLSRFCLP